MREFFDGARMLLRGLAFWRRIPGPMMLGLVPAAIVGIVLFAGLVILSFHLPRLAEFVTPFADGWPGLWAGVVRVAVGTAMLGAAFVVIAISFTALTLLIGEPFYDRIWRAAERDLGGVPADTPYGFWRSVGDGFSFVGRGIAVAIAAGLLGLIPVVGGIAGAVGGVLMTGWLLADELSSRALSARGIDHRARRALLAGNRARTLGFGVATQLCFFVPLGAVLIMPAAVAGSTVLARSLVGPAELTAADQRSEAGG
ncbi:EI24 domain-containing protein [Microbacterium sp. CJ77]|uniref:EI24 domain-containing protein n=1 Tax=Microbacterium sp. CJ77 TaxID=2079201 RepID=UPI000CD88487|nr:EI24 domain-containing protein [Microbacterium sp. CJ77]